MTHTAEPWPNPTKPIYEEYANLYYCLLKDKENYILQKIWGRTAEEAEANADRIVACVNACAGIPNEVLTSEHRKHDAFFEAMEQEIRCDRLIDLLNECKLQLQYLNEKFGETGTTNALLTKIETATQKI